MAIENSEIRPDINKNILFLIVLFFIIFEAYVLFVPFDITEFQIVDGLFLAAPLSSAVLAFLIATKSGAGRVYHISYFVLGVACVLFFLGDFMWIVVYDIILDIDPYPSLADIFYFGL